MVCVLFGSAWNFWFDFLLKRKKDRVKEEKQRPFLCKFLLAAENKIYQTAFYDNKIS